MMRRIALIALSLLSFQASADVEMYVEVDGKEIILAGQCRCDGLHWGECAIAHRSLVRSDEDMVMCWKTVGDKIIFTNDTFTIERDLKDVKIRVYDDPSPKPVDTPTLDQPPA